MSFDQRTSEERLVEALAAHRQFLDEGGDAGEFLARNPHLRDLLGPMLAGDNASNLDEPSIGDFRLLRELGRGGMGIVWEAEQRSLARRVAVKLLSPMLLLDAGALARFRREAQLAASLEHPGITRVLAFAADSDQAYIAMELVAGAPLSAVLNSVHTIEPSLLSSKDLRAATASAAVVDCEPDAVQSGSRGATTRGIDVVVDWITEVAAALHAAHSRGIVHRDIKPSNIMIRVADSTAALTDFGMAREAGALGVTRTGEFAGTVSYAAPEQFRGDVRSIGPAADIFSLGVTLYELLTFRRPFDGDTIAETQVRIERVEPRNPRRFNALVDRDLWSVVARALEKTPARRYPTAEAFAADLLRWRRGEPVRARPLAWPQRTARWARRSPLASSFLSFAMIALVVFAWLAIQSNNNANRAEAALGDFDALAIGERLARVQRRATELPTAAEHAGAFAELLQEAEELVDLRPRVRLILEQVRSRGSLRTEPEREFAARTHPLAKRFRELRAEHDEAEELLEFVDGSSAKYLHGCRGNRPGILAAELELLEPVLASYRQFEFELARDQVLHDRIEDAVFALDRFADIGLEDLRDRAAWMGRVVPETVDAHADLWSKTVAAVAAEPKYRGLRLSPQNGLIPLGADPDSGLQEFAHPRSGSRTVSRGPSGQLDRGSDSCIVFVLVPPGDVEDLEVVIEDQEPRTVPYPVSVDAFFLSKYEMSRHQWQQLTRYRPSLAQISKRSMRGFAEADGKPVIFASWEDSSELMRRENLALPTCAQWRWAAVTDQRGGWWDCAPETTVQLGQRANVYLDGRGRGTIPVDKGFANPFGFHNMLGNVWEWCDDSLTDAIPTDRSDGRALRYLPQPARAMAGGSYVESPAEISLTPTRGSTGLRQWTSGLRPARGIDPS